MSGLKGRFKISSAASAVVDAAGSDTIKNDSGREHFFCLRLVRVLFSWAQGLGKK
jgi:hypothetical protein